jgi:tRNA(Ile)-lysidine synthase
MNASESLLGRLREFVQRFRLIEHGERIILAVSGGSDSMVLLDAFERLKTEFQLTLAIAHFNHRLRGEESDRDEVFVRSATGERGLECYVERADTRAIADARRQSIEETARELRYDFFRKLRTSLGYQRVATAHQADDNAETILFNLFRGAGVRGLSGIPVRRSDQCVIRPLLFATKELIMDYAAERAVRYREDSTNAGNEYTRNFLRHEVIPLIRRNVNPNLIVTLRRTGQLFDQLEDYLGEVTRNVLPSVIVRETPRTIVVDSGALLDQPAFLQEHLLLHLARKFTSRDVDFGTVKTMLRVAGGETGSSCSIGGETVFYRNRKDLIFSRVKRLVPYRHRIELNRRYEFERFDFGSAPSGEIRMSADPNTEYVDADTLGKECVLRSWKEGDWFVPLGMREKKKLSDFFIDEKIPLFEKLAIPIFVSDGEIVWVCGKRLDDRHKIMPTTTRVVKLEYAPRRSPDE